MQKHTKIYLDHFGYDETDFIGCEICNKKAVDIIAVCRECHIKCHSNREFNQKAKEIHLRNV